MGGGSGMAGRRVGALHGRTSGMGNEDAVRRGRREAGGKAAACAPRSEAEGRGAVHGPAALAVQPFVEWDGGAGGCAEG